jgi:hypothetical protein
LQYLTVFGSASWKDAGSGQEVIFLIRGIHCGSVPENPPVGRVLVKYLWGTGTITWNLVEEVEEKGRDDAEAEGRR